MEKQWENLLNRQIKIIFDDGINHFSKKVGVLTAVTTTHAILLVQGKTEAISLLRILRMEEIINGQ